MLYKILHFQEIFGRQSWVSVMNVTVLSNKNHLVPHLGIRPPCCVLLLLPVDLQSRSYHVNLFHFISSHTSLPVGAHIDPQRDPVSGRSLRSQANLVVTGITRCNCPFWFIATDPICVLSRSLYNRKCRRSIYLFTLGFALTPRLSALILQLKQFLWREY